jgi:MFS family permease
LVYHPAVSLPPARGLSRAIASLHGNRPFLLLWLSNIFFFGGAWTLTLILGWLVFETTGSEFLLAVFTAVRLAPLLLGPVAGVLSDRFDRMRLLLVAGTWALLAVTALAAAVSLTSVPYWVLLVGGLAIGLAQSPSQPARSSLVVDLVGRTNLSNANALNSMAMNMTQVIGPAIGGVLISTVGAPAALWIAAVWYAAALVLLLPLRHVGSTRAAAPEAVLRMLVGGFRSIAANRLASAVLLVTLAANILSWPVFQSFMPVFAGETLSLDASGLGWLLTCSGIGGLVGSVIIAALGDFRFKGGLFVIGTGVWAALWALFALSRSAPLSFALMAGIGLASAAFGVLQTTLLLMTTEPAVHGRALGLQELAIGAIPVASLALGAIAEAVGVGPTTFVAALLLVGAIALLGLRVPQLVRYSGVQG